MPWKVPGAMLVMERPAKLTIPQVGSPQALPPVLESNPVGLTAKEHLSAEQNRDCRHGAVQRLISFRLRFKAMISKHGFRHNISKGTFTEKSILMYECHQL
jgi:hypothetical protein